MPAPKGKKSLQENRARLGILAKENAEAARTIASMESTQKANEEKVETLKKVITDQEDEISSISTSIEGKREKVEALVIELRELEREEKKMINRLSNIKRRTEVKVNDPALLVINSRKRKLQKSTGAVCERTKKRRVALTFESACKIHGGTTDDPGPAIEGLLQALSSKCSNALLAMKLLNLKQSVTNIITTSIKKQHCLDIYNSEENALRSLNIYYCSNVLGKNKYISLRKANKQKDVPNVIPYSLLAKKIREIPIGELLSIEGNLDEDLCEDEKGSGFYRNFKSYLPRLAEFYINVNDQRHDKLIDFNSVPVQLSSVPVQLSSVPVNSSVPINNSITNPWQFHFAIGGDKAPVAGTSFLVSFLNAGKRICSSYDNFLIFAGNVKESGEVVRRYITKLMVDITYVENEVFHITKKNGEVVYVTFKLALLPNDMKMLAFLAGELSNAAAYPCTFGNVSKDNITRADLTFGGEGEEDWKPFDYDKRIMDSILVERKKKTLKRNTTFRTHVTDYIRSLRSRQEFAPLVGKYIDLAVAEALHLKNNVCKEVFLKVFDVVSANAAVCKKVKKFKEIPEDNLLSEFVNYVKKDMQCNKLSKKLKEWWEDCNGKGQAFSFRFRGEESRNYLSGFPEMIVWLLSKIYGDQWINRLMNIFAQSIYLRKVISYSVRVTNVDAEDITDMEDLGKKLFRLCCIHDNTVTPSTWTLANVAPKHANHLLKKYGLGLGCNSMEGREQKHQKIKQYMSNATVVDRWKFVFRHEFVSCVYLREHGFDDKNYRKKTVSYLPLPKDGHCSCGLVFVANSTCQLCDSDLFKNIQQELNS